MPAWSWLLGGEAIALLLAALLVLAVGCGSADQPSDNPTAAADSAQQNPVAGAAAPGNSANAGNGKPTDPSGANSTDNDAGTPSADFNIAAEWTFSTDVTEANGACRGEEELPNENAIVRIEQLPDGGYQITGLEGEGGQPWKGDYQGAHRPRR